MESIVINYIQTPQQAFLVKKDPYSTLSVD